MSDQIIEPEVEKTTDLVQYQHPSALLALAIQKDLDIDKLKSLMELQKDWEANEARKAFVQAMADFKKDPPKIFKDAHVEMKTQKGTVKYDHASLGNVVASVTESLSKHNMSVNWQTEQSEKAVKVTCKITHAAGHHETTAITAPPDTTGVKNMIQAIGSTITYLQRYTLLAICGLATNEFEIDGHPIKNGNQSQPPKQNGKPTNGKAPQQDGEIDKELDKLIQSLIRQVDTLFAQDKKKRETWLNTIERISSLKAAEAIKTTLSKIEK